MSAIDSLGGVPTTQIGSPDAFAALGTAEFLDIIFTELGNQDPLEPSDTQATLDQLSTLWSIQSDSNMITQLESIVAQNGLASAANLIGHEISGLNELGVRVQGTVSSAINTTSGAILRLDDGSFVPMATLEQVLAPPAPAETDTTDTSNDDTDDSNDDETDETDGTGGGSGNEG